MMVRVVAAHAHYPAMCYLGSRETRFITRVSSWTAYGSVNILFSPGVLAPPANMCVNKYELSHRRNCRRFSYRIVISTAAFRPCAPFSTYCLSPDPAYTEPSPRPLQGM